MSKPTLLLQISTDKKTSKWVQGKIGRSVKLEGSRIGQPRVVL